MARSVYSFAVFTLPHGSSTIAVCSDGRLSDCTVQSDSVGLYGRLRRTKGAQRVHYKSPMHVFALCLLAGRQTDLNATELFPSRQRHRILQQTRYVCRNRVSHGRAYRTLQ